MDSMDSMDSIEEFQKFLYDKTLDGRRINVLALVGAGLSAPSGVIPSNIGDTDGDNVWRNYSFIDLATLDAFDSNPALVWLYYALKRHQALKAEPNEGHKVLAQLSNLNDKFNLLTISQNMDGLHHRSGHNSEKLLEFHGSLFNVKCTNFMCYYSKYTLKDPLTDSLDVTKYEDSENTQLPIINSLDQLPLCPDCLSNGEKYLLRPGVIWFGESLPLYLIDQADEFIIENDIDLLLVIGTSHTVWPTSSYIDIIKNNGGAIAVFNIVEDSEIDKIKETSNTKVWNFIGDCSITLPKVFNSIINS